MRQKVVALLTSPWFVFMFLLSVLCIPHFVRGEILGPFDLLVSFYHPYRDIVWKDPNLAAKAVHYKNYLQSDAVSVVLPVKLLAIRYIKQGILPLWNPLLMNGIPLFGNIQTALLYPTTILYFLLSAPVAYTISIVAQLVLAFAGMRTYLKNRELSAVGQTIGALSFTFSAYMIVWLPWGTIGHALIWLPWILFFIDRYEKTRAGKYLAGISMGIALSLFAGHTQTTLIITTLCLMYTVRSLQVTRTSLCIIGSVLLGLGTSAIQIFPSLEMYRESARELLATNTFYNDQTLSGGSFIQLIAPDFFGNPVTQNWWGKINYAESALYFGATSCVLALFASMKAKFDTKKFWVIIAALGIITSTANPILYLLFKLNIPVFSSSTFARNSLLIIVAGSILAAHGVDALMSRLNKNAQIHITLLATAPLAIIWVLVLTRILPAEYIPNITIIKHNLILPTAFLMLFVGGIWTIPKKYLGLLLVGILALELARFTNKYTVFSPAEFFYPQHPMIQQLQEKQPARYFQYLQPNSNTVFDIPTIEGSEPLYPKRLGILAGSGDGSGKLRNRAAIEFPDGQNKPRLLNLFSAEYLADKQDNYRNNWEGQYGGRYGDFDSNFKFLWTDHTYMLYKNKHAVPPEHLYFDSKEVRGEQEAIKTLANPLFDPLKTITIEGDRSLQSDGAKGTITVLRRTPLESSYRVDSTAPAIFATTNTYYPGWKASIDGKKTNLLISNGAFRAVRIPKGKHSIRFQYAPSSVLHGLYLSLLSVALLGILLYWNNNAFKQTRDNHGKLQ